MENVHLRKAALEDKAMVIEVDYRLDPVEHVALKREEKIAKAILDEECFIILADHQPVGFVIFDYRFFDQGWIELIIISDENRGKGIGRQTFDLLCQQCEAKKVFTSTNSSNIPMQKALAKAGFSFAGKIIGLDEGDPELFYFKVTDKSKN